MGRKKSNGRYKGGFPRYKLKCTIPGCGRYTYELVPDPRYENQGPSEQKFCCTSCRKRLRRRTENDTKVHTQGHGQALV